MVIDLEKVRDQILSYPIDDADLRILKLFLNPKTVKCQQINEKVCLLVKNSLVKNQLDKGLFFIEQAIRDLYQKNFSVEISLFSNFKVSSNNEKFKEIIRDKNVTNQIEKDSIKSSFEPITRKFSVRKEKQEDVSIPNETFLPSHLINQNTQVPQNNTKSIKDDFSVSSVKNPKKLSTGVKEIEVEGYHDSCFYKDLSTIKNKNFDNFVEGKTNAKLLSSAKGASNNPGSTLYNPFFVYGGSGLGKSHILTAMANEMEIRFPNLKIQYIGFSNLFNNWTKAITEYYSNKNNSLIEEFNRFYRSLDVLIIDDIQELEQNNHQSFCTDFTKLLSELLESTTQLIFASSKYPGDIKKVEPKLLSRLMGGSTIKVEPPDFENRKGIIRNFVITLNKLEAKNISFDNKSVEFIAGIFQSDVRMLEGKVKTVFASTHNLPSDVIVTLDIVKEALRDSLESLSRHLTVDNIKNTVAEYFGFSVKDIDSKNRTQPLAYARMIAMALSRELTDESYPSLGKKFGNKDHSTVVNAVKRVAILRNKDQKYKDAYEVLKTQLQVK